VHVVPKSSGRTVCTVDHLWRLFFETFNARTNQCFGSLQFTLLTSQPRVWNNCQNDGVIAALDGFRAEEEPHCAS
jgi:hypothetical protein